MFNRLLGARQARRRSQIRQLIPFIMAALAVLHPLSSQAQHEPIEHFVTRSFIHGLPKERAQQYGAEAVEGLHDMLNEPAYRPHLSNVIGTLGYIGNEATVPLLKELYAKHLPLEGVIKPTDKESDLKDALDAIRRAMGRLGAKGHKEATGFLKRNCDLRRLQKLQAFQQLDEQHARFAWRETMMGSMMALSAVGTEDAIDALQKLKSNAETLSQQLQDPVFEDVVDGALSRALEIRSRKDKSKG